eukprot:6464682-Amphidinium_carterae.1
MICFGSDGQVTGSVYWTPPDDLALFNHYRVYLADNSTGGNLLQVRRPSPPGTCEQSWRVAASHKSLQVDDGGVTTGTNMITISSAVNRDGRDHVCVYTANQIVCAANTDHHGHVGWWVSKQQRGPVPRREQVWVPEMALRMARVGLPSLHGAFAGCSVAALKETLESWRCVSSCRGNYTVEPMIWSES